ncbi:MBL fold metallo-hydrolase [Nocardioides sp. zg-536]|uniref:MBL fold metallo-hydrolase n=1 Tax=Nocardioides faecalis TaxID=2803858 RepID=A0A939BZD1_9ACTN|nr:MBL fold metallo-hydrolase [Nocardioides faecalis]MBM9461188.1 MBL fold metallo-hydrolase [Nocardioides faecalis]QVI59036.1 MBL fold metallo-hydrolase [Nocardioides faecalis]
MSIPLHEIEARTYRERRVASPGAVVDGVWAVPVPLHGSPLRSVTVHLLESSAGLVLVDAGYEHPGCWTAFRDGLATLGLGVEEICAVLLSHNHPDHVGFADRVRQASGAEVVIHREDDFDHQRAIGRGGFLDQLRRALPAAGVPAETAQRMYDEAVKVAHHAEDLVPDRILDGDTDLTYGDLVVRVLHTPGHTPGHTVHVAHGVVLTGDTMMPEGPTQLAIPSLPGDAPARDLLATLTRIRDLAAHGEVHAAAPAHQYAYRDVAERATELLEHHAGERERALEVAATHGAGASAWDVAPHLRWAKPWEDLGHGTRRFALMHTAALLAGG